MAVPYVAGARQIRADYNYVSTFNIHKPDIDPRMVERYGSQLLTELLSMVGNKTSTSNIEFSHFEEDRIMPKIKATSAGAGAGLQATFSMVAASQQTVPQNTSPYLTGTTTTVDAIPVRLNDVILIKPTLGIISSSTYIRAFVDGVNATANTFTARPVDTTDSVPAIASADEIIIIGNAHGEGSGRPEGMNPTVTQYSNNVQIIKDSYDITGTEDSLVLWTEVTNQNGQKGYLWRLKGEKDTYYRFLNHKEMTLLLSEKLTNVAIANAQATAGTPVKMTEGLIPFILSQGNISNYSSVTGFTLTDAQNLVKQLDKQKGAKNNLFLAGISLSLQMDDTLADRVQNGAITYGSKTFAQDNEVNTQFSRFKIGEYVFNKKTYDAFNDLQTLGANGFSYTNEGMVIPMDSRVDAKSREEIPSLRLRYLEGREMVHSARNMLDVNGNDKFEVDYLSECGFEGFGGNRFAYIKQA